MRHHAAPQPIYVHVRTQTAAPVIEYMASALANKFVASAPVIEYVAPVSVTTLLEPPVHVVHVMQVPQVQVVEKTVEFPLEPQIVQETVETMRLASHEQVQQRTVEHVPQIFKETAETMRWDSHEQMQPTPAVTCATPVPVIECVTPSPVIEYIAPEPSVTSATPGQQFPPAYTMSTVTTDASSDTTGFVNPQFSAGGLCLTCHWFTSLLG